MGEPDSQHRLNYLLLLKKILTLLIINGAECESYLTADYRIMLELTDEIIFGIKAVIKALVLKSL